MADPLTLASAVAPSLIKSTFAAGLPPLNDLLGETVRSCLYLADNQSSLVASLRQLKTAAEKLKANVEEEEAQMRIRNPDVREWLNTVEKVVNRIEPLFVNNRPADGTSQHGMCTCCNAALFRGFCIGRKVIRELKNVTGLLAEGGLFTPPFTSPQPQEAVQEMPILNPIFGTDVVIDQVWSQFNNKHVSIIGLYGLGGVGKTTLLKRFNNQLRVKNDGYQFQVVIMLEVANAKTLNVAGMQRIISDRLGVRFHEDKSDVDRAALLIQVLKNKKFVVLLDDVWNNFQLKDIGIPTPLPEGNGSKLIVASREQPVCASMGAKSPIEVECLKKDEAWSLFLSKLTDDMRVKVNDNRDMKQCAEEIVKGCGGLPLFIDVIGQYHAADQDVEDFQSTVCEMRQNPSNIPGVEGCMTVLKLSYDMLEDTHKQCFLYCTMFPEYGSIRKEQLVEYWVAEGLISSRDKGYPSIRKLHSASLLQRSDAQPASEVKMHQMIRKMGHQQTSAKNKLLIMAGQALEQAPDASEWEEATRISLVSNDIRKLSISPNCTKLLTLLLQNNPNLYQLGSKFFRSMPVLKVLDLSHTDISVLPDCRNLNQLVYLNLSHTSITEVPKQLCNTLVGIQYLNMSHTLITTLPQQLVRLEKLTHLNLEETLALSVIPHGTISRLFKLNVLNLYKSNYGMKDLPDLNLEGLQQLTFLGITIYSQQVFRKLRKSDPLARCTRFLSLACCRGMRSIQLSDFKTMINLTELHIKTCDDLEELIVDCDDRNDNAKSMTVLTLVGLRNLTHVSYRSVTHQLQDLRDLNIHECPKLQNVSWVLELESLERLVITECHGLKQVVQEEMDQMHGRELNEESPVPGGRNPLLKLRIMELKDLSQLESIGGTRGFPRLESITVFKCPKLTQLPAQSTLLAACIPS